MTSCASSSDEKTSHIRMPGLFQSPLSLLFPRQNRPKFTQPFLIGEMLQALYHLCGPSLDSSGDPCLFELGAENWTQCARCVSPVQSREEASPTSTCWPCSFDAPWDTMASWPQGHTTGSWPTCSWPTSNKTTRFFFTELLCSRSGADRMHPQLLRKLA